MDGVSLWTLGSFVLLLSWLGGMSLQTRQTHPYLAMRLFGETMFLVLGLIAISFLIFCMPEFQVMSLRSLIGG